MKETESEKLKELGKVLTTLRGDMTKYRITKETGIRTPTLLKMERGTLNYGVVNLMKYLDALGINLKDIISQFMY